MAAPQRSLRDLSGSWSQNKDLSSDVSPVLQIQGFNSLLISAVKRAPINLSITQHSDDEILIEQSTTAGIPAVKEEWYPPASSKGSWGEWRENEDSFLGKVRSRSRWVKVGQLDGKGDAWLIEGLSKDEEVVEADVQAFGGTEWKARQVWRMDGEGRFVRRVVTTGNDGRREETVLVYDLKG
jgi:hypothetical protein